MGEQLSGVVEQTYLGGELVYADGIFVELDNGMILKEIS
jgi:hypothetical protein